MRWRKLDRRFVPPVGLDWMASHAALPFLEPRNGYQRVYCSGRDAHGRGQIGYVDLDLADPERPPRPGERPVLGPGPLGAFDDNGVTMSWLVTRDGRTLLYYTGWTLGVTVPFYFYIGAAASDDGGETFQRLSPAPILERNAVDPYLTASPCVLVEDDRWRMWYVSCLGWEAVGEQVKHTYHIRYAESADGLHWERSGQVCVDFASPDEYAFGRPCVVRDPDGYRMWYCVRGAAYRLGYAESGDGLHWERKDAEAGLELSAEGWDAEMQAYPFVFDHAGRRYLLYNGNGYGKTGFGLAVLDSCER